MHQQHTSSGNPLQKYFRQPKIYLTLPSKGKWYPAGALDMPENGELPVFSMTAKDEIMMKTPDALLNGQATVEVIQSCIPAIKNAWEMPTQDLDAVLIAIRIATYGEKMDIDVKVPGTSIDKQYEVDMQTMLTNISLAEFIETVNINGLNITVRPITYKEFTKNSMKTFEEQRIFNTINNEGLTEEEKINIFNRSFQNLTQMTLDAIENSIVSIEVEGETVTEQRHIKDFFANTEKSVFRSVAEHIEAQREKFIIKPILVDATPEEIEQGAPETYDVPITFDPSNFFA